MPDPLKTLVKNLNEDQYVAIEDDYLDQIDKLSEEGVIRIFYRFVIFVSFSEFTLSKKILALN